MNDQKQKYTPDDEITLKELILKLQEYFTEVWSYRKLIVLLTIPFILLMLARAMMTPITYPASLTFMVNEDEGGGLGGVGAILGQFGLGGGGGGKNNLDKMLELTKSRKIIQQVMFEKVTVNGEYDYIANHLIKIYDFHDNWNKNDGPLKDFLFTTNNIVQFTQVENRALKSIYGTIVGGEKKEGLLKSGYGKETGIMRFSVNTLSEDFSIALVHQVYEKLGTFYVEKTVEKQQQTYQIIEEKVDSLQRLIAGKELSLAKFKDSSRGIITQKDRLRERQLSRDLSVLNLVYGEALKNLEIADFSLKSKTPFIQLIDAPISPIFPVGKSKLMAIILGGILGGFIGVGFVIARKLYRDAMNE